MGSRTEMLDAHLDPIMNATAGRTVLCPTFNYYYCRTGHRRFDTYERSVR